jgi:LmbE family N-acetylglucosaminyl deacetylase
LNNSGKEPSRAVADTHPAVTPSAPTAAIVVAHPDDETLWAGGFVLEYAEWDWFIGTLCRASDPDRAPKFARVLERLRARGAMADMEDGPEQQPLPAPDVQRQVRVLLPRIHFDLLLTHGPLGEYTWHRRHVEVCRAVVALWRAGQISAGALWLFAYEDGGRQYLPRAVLNAHVYQSLSAQVWRTKFDLVTQVYGFHPESWEARTTPRAEAFWCFESPRRLDMWLHQEGLKL